MSVLIQKSAQGRVVGNPAKLEDPLAPLQCFDNLRRDTRVESNNVARQQPSPRTPQRRPPERTDSFQQQELDASAGYSLPEESRRDHARIIEHHAITGANKLREIPEQPVLPGPGRAVDHQHPRRIPLFRRRLGNPFFGKRVIEIRKSGQDLRVMHLVHLVVPVHFVAVLITQRSQMTGDGRDLAGARRCDVLFAP